MRLNTLQPADGARTERKRVGRGIGSGLGKTAGRGHKGSFARAGKGKIKAGFEGGQMPMQRRLPKIGFRSLIKKDTAEVLLYALDKLDAGDIDVVQLLHEAEDRRQLRGERLEIGFRHLDPRQVRDAARGVLVDCHGGPRSMLAAPD